MKHTLGSASEHSSEIHLLDKACKMNHCLAFAPWIQKATKEQTAAPELTTVLVTAQNKLQKTSIKNCLYRNYFTPISLATESMTLPCL